MKDHMDYHTIRSIIDHAGPSQTRKLLQRPTLHADHLYHIANIFKRHSAEIMQMVCNHPNATPEIHAAYGDNEHKLKALDHESLGPHSVHVAAIRGNSQVMMKALDHPNLISQTITGITNDHPYSDVHEHIMNKFWLRHSQLSGIRYGSDKQATRNRAHDMINNFDFKMDHEMHDGTYGFKVWRRGEDKPE